VSELDYLLYLSEDKIFKKLKKTGFYKYLELADVSGYDIDLWNDFGKPIEFSIVYTAILKGFENRRVSVVVTRSWNGKISMHISVFDSYRGRDYLIPVTKSGFKKYMSIRKNRR